ncbi:MAG TPA: hypothetical protein VHX12_14750, partial [Acidisoma sp.]|nr:hypothetical protein [Acidisoma sp.]
MNTITATSDDRLRESREMIAHLQESEIYRTYASAFESATGLPLALRPVGTLQFPLRASKNCNPFC